MTDIPSPPRGDGNLPPSGGRDHLVRSEEQLQVATERVVTGIARLEKFVITETRSFTVEVSHEEFRLIHVPVADSAVAPHQPNAVGQMNAARWLQAHREEVVITKRLVPTERARLEVYPVTEQHQVIEEVRRERFDLSEAGEDSTLPTRP